MRFSRVFKLLQDRSRTNRLFANLSLLKSLVVRELDARYQGSVLGRLWPLVTQLSQLLIYTYVFSTVLQIRLNLKGLAENRLTFALWLFAGLLPWIAFTNGQGQSAYAVISRPNLVKKVVFPLALLPLVPVFSVFIESMFGLLPLLFLVALVSQHVHWSLLLLPLPWSAQLLLTAGIGYFVAGLSVFLRDTPQTLSIIVNLWFYLTPIVYPTTSMPEKLRQLMYWANPMAAIVDVYRDLILAGGSTHWIQLGIATIVSLLIFLCGFGAYRRLQPSFADVL